MRISQCALELTLSAIAINLRPLLATANKGSLTLSVLFLDGSSSMRKHGEAPSRAVNSYLDTLRGDCSRQHAAMLITFGGTYRVDIPAAPVNRIGLYNGYWTSSGTLLYQTVKRGLQGLVEEYVLLSTAERSRFRIVVAVFSDGYDNCSDRSSYPLALREFSARARKYGWTLQAYGIGIDGTKLANDMGFDPKFATTVAASPEGIQIATSRAGQIATATRT